MVESRANFYIVSLMAEFCTSCLADKNALRKLIHQHNGKHMIQETEFKMHTDVEGTYED